jgi:hypothetical protein
MRQWIAGGFAAVSVLVACGGGDDTNGPQGVTSFTGNYGWTCAPTGTNCQDVFNFTVTAGSVFTIRVNTVSSGSVAQLALYGPGVSLGGVNLLTGTTKELRCTTGGDCNLFIAGEHVSAITLSQAGTYRLAVTRDWGNSCGGTGTYHLEVTSTVAFQVAGQTVEDQASLASGFECH